MDFQGKGLALSQLGIDNATRPIGVSPAELWTVLKVETSGCGFLPDRRPVILFERHVFHRLTQGQFDDGDISDATPGGYGATGAHQFDRLTRAIAMDRGAALQSASWGMGQIMGENHTRAGFADVEIMVSNIVGSEDNQLIPVASFLRSTGLAVALSKHDWQSFARGYNGPHFAANHYDTRLAAVFAALTLHGVPDLTVRASQLYLTYLGFNPGPVDGVMGAKTMAAVQGFCIGAGRSTINTIDDVFVQALLDALDGQAKAATT